MWRADSLENTDAGENWVLKNRRFWIVVRQKTLERHLNSKEIKPVNPKGNQPWTFTGRTDVEAKAPKLWPPDEKSRLTGKDPDAGKDWRQEEKRETEGEMAQWHYQLNGHEFDQTLGDSEGQRSLVCCSPWDPQESDRISDWTTTSESTPRNLLWSYTIHSMKIKMHKAIFHTYCKFWKLP